VSRELAAQAAEEWQRGDYYDAHETLELLVDAVEADDDDWTIGLALVKAAAALHKHVEQVGPAAVPGKLERALEDLDPAPAEWFGLDLGALRAELRAMREDLLADRPVAVLPQLRIAAT
jgi:hypothetical protein